MAVEGLNPSEVTKSKKLTVYSRLFCVLERIEFIQMSDKRAREPFRGRNNYLSSQEPPTERTFSKARNEG